MDQDVHGIAYRAIGILRSPFTDIKGMPVQPVGALGVTGHVEVHADFADGFEFRLALLRCVACCVLWAHMHRHVAGETVERTEGSHSGTEQLAELAARVRDGQHAEQAVFG